MTAAALTRSWKHSRVSVSKATVKRRLSGVGLKGRRARKKPMLTDKHKEKRLKFAKDHADWTVSDWSVVLFTDESKFNMFASDGPTYIRRRKGEDHLPECIVPTVKFNGGSVMMWGGMSFRGVGLLKQITGTLNKHGYKKILGDYAFPSAHVLGYGDDFFMQDDGAPCHRAIEIKDWKEDNEMKCILNWPPQSPDLNPIENLWFDIKKELKEMRHHNLKELAANVHTCWAKITEKRCRKLIRSMPRRIRAVIKAKGGHTKY